MREREKEDTLNRINKMSGDLWKLYDKPMSDELRAWAGYRIRDLMAFRHEMCSLVLTDKEIDDE